MHIYIYVYIYRYIFVCMRVCHTPAVCSGKTNCARETSCLYFDRMTCCLCCETTRFFHFCGIVDKLKRVCVCVVLQTRRAVCVGAATC